MHWTRSGEIMMMVILGGIGTLIGPVFGAAAYLLLESVLSRWTEHWPALLGPLLIVIVLCSRSGLLGLLASRPGPQWLKPLLATTGLTKRFGGLLALTDVVAVGHARRNPRDHRPERGRQDDAGLGSWPANCAPMPARSASPGMTSRGSGRRGGRRSASRARSRSPRCFASSPRSTMSRWRCRRMPDTASASGARLPATRCCASRRVPRWPKSGSPAGPTRRPPRCRMASGARSNWRWCWRAGRACCCSTSRWPGWARPNRPR